MEEAQKGMARRKWSHRGRAHLPAPPPSDPRPCPPPARLTTMASLALIPPTPSSPSPLPTEILSHILSFLFLPPIPLTPTSSPSHLLGTSHVLLVSRTIYTLSLPHFYHTVILSRPSHFKHFFCPKTGIFTSDPDGMKGKGREDLWSHVRHLGIVSGVGAPVRPRKDGQFITAQLIPLVVPLLPTLETACLLISRTGTSPPSLAAALDTDDPSVDELVRRTQEDPMCREQAQDELFEEYDRGEGEDFSGYMHRAYGGIGPKAVVDRWIGSRVREVVRRETQGFVSRLLQLEMM